MMYSAQRNRLNLAVAPFFLWLIHFWKHLTVELIVANFFDYTLIGVVIVAVVIAILIIRINKQ